MKLNAIHFYERFLDPEFIAPWITVPGLLLALALVFRRMAQGRQVAVVFLLGLFAATHFILI